jgi:hypothetical protein
MEELPSKLRQQLAEKIHKKLYNEIIFFKGKDHTFNTWVSNQLKPLNVQSQNNIYKCDE